MSLMLFEDQADKTQAISQFIIRTRSFPDIYNGVCAIRPPSSGDSSVELQLQ